MLRIRGTRWRGRFLLALGSMAITLLLAEVGARVHHATHGGSAVRLDDAAAVSAARERRENHALRLGDIVRPAPWDDVVYELIPGMQGDFIGVPYRTNSHGMRDRELPLRKPADEYRIALIGDSFAFGWGVADGKTFADRLEHDLADAVPGRRVEVLNFGVPGYNTAIEAAVLRRRAMAFEPDLVLVQFYKNDYHLPNFLLDPEPAPVSYLLDFVRRRLSPRARALRRSDEGADVRGAYQDWMADPERVPASAASMVGPDGVVRGMEAIRDAAAERSVPVVFFLLEVPMDGMLDLSPADLDARSDGFALEAAKRLGFVAFSSMRRMAAQLNRDGLKIGDVILSDADWHLNAVGSRLLTNVIRRHLLETVFHGDRDRGDQGDR